MTTIIHKENMLADFAEAKNYKKSINYYRWIDNSKNNKLGVHSREYITNTIKKIARMQVLKKI